MANSFSPYWGGAIFAFSYQSIENFVLIGF
jgi:hypothetical protein